MELYHHVALHQCKTVQGVVAFHPAAAEDPSYCAAWVTVCASKVALLVAVLFFFMNLATWKENEGMLQIK